MAQHVSTELAQKVSHLDKLSKFFLRNWVRPDEAVPGMVVRGSKPAALEDGHDGLQVRRGTVGTQLVKDHRHTCVGEAYSSSIT